MSIASLLKSRQKQLKLSTYKLAKRLRISFATVQRVLSASSQPNVRTMAKYAKFLGMSAAALERKTRPAMRVTAPTRRRATRRRRTALA